MEGWGGEGEPVGGVEKGCGVGVYHLWVSGDKDSSVSQFLDIR